MLPTHDKPFGTIELVCFCRRGAASGRPGVYVYILCPLGESYAGIIWIADDPVNVRGRKAPSSQSDFCDIAAILLPCVVRISAPTWLCPASVVFLSRKGEST